MKKTLMAVALTIAVLPVFAADIAKGEALAQSQCAACHGKDLMSPIDKTYPRIAGQYEDYVVKALHDYQTGARKNAIMGAIAKPLSRADIQNVAAYIDSLPTVLNNNKR